MIFPERVFGSLVGELDLARRGDGAEDLAHVLDQLGAQRLAGLLAAAQEDEGLDRLPLDRVGLADHRRLADGGVADQRRLDVGGADAVAGDVEDVIGAAENGDVAILVVGGDVAGDVHPGMRRKYSS